MTAMTPFNASRTPAKAAHNAGEYLSFRLGSEAYGIDILKVQEIRGYELPTRIAGCPNHILGVLDLRGVIVPILDLRIRLGLADVPYDSFTVVIVLNVTQRVVGVVVDSVSDVIEIAAAQVKPAPEFHGAVDASFITGLTSMKSGDQERLLILTDIEALIGGTDLGNVDSAPLQ